MRGRTIVDSGLHGRGPVLRVPSPPPSPPSPRGLTASIVVAPALFLAALLLAGCGGGPTIDRAVAVALARQADAVAARVRAGDACTARAHARTLQRQTIAAINAGKIPADFQETLQARVTEIDHELEPRCLPAPPPAPKISQQPSGGAERGGKSGPEPKQHGHGRGKHNGHDHGHGHAQGG